MINESQQKVLLKLARETIDLYLKDGKKKEPNISDPALTQVQGAFVTLHTSGQLRGCIGNLTANEPLSEGVRRNAVNAAFQDPRFAPLTEAELEKVDIEVSILSEPQALAYSDGADLLSKLRVNIDGVIIRKGQAGATFLPQVWEQLPGPEDFLSHLCQKAGLASNAWRDGNLEVQTYQVQYFEEHN